jgi:hypothetical protein
LLQATTFVRSTSYSIGIIPFPSEIQSSTFLPYQEKIPGRSSGLVFGHFKAKMTYPQTDFEMVFSDLHMRVATGQAAEGRFRALLGAAPLVIRG